eukprot:TRINITY_DN8659_c0_g1_i11.p1 TRINITY_DN8659_c0_g1~~TRINITY_DN8659_c0_g1_i11.p1  ORF type:complete len:216 (-),score=57.64 TRINITY_DN8659_c0_g1_i11:272-919(-)
MMHRRSQMQQSQAAGRTERFASAKSREDDRGRRRSARKSKSSRKKKSSSSSSSSSRPQRTRKRTATMADQSPGYQQYKKEQREKESESQRRQQADALAQALCDRGFSLRGAPAAVEFPPLPPGLPPVPKPIQDPNIEGYKISSAQAAVLDGLANFSGKFREGMSKEEVLRELRGLGKCADAKKKTQKLYSRAQKPLPRSVQTRMEGVYDIVVALN